MLDLYYVSLAVNVNSQLGLGGTAYQVSQLLIGDAILSNPSPELFSRLSSDH
jgi:hypothetical protein